MSTVPSLFSKKLTKSILNNFLPDKISGDEKFELIIRLKDGEISVRDFSAYLNFIDQAYGRLTPKGLIYYSRTSKYELKICEMRRGSFEIVIWNLLADTGSVKALIIIGLLLKYLPQIIKCASAAYRDYEEGRLARIQRHLIKQQIESDEKLIELQKQQINQLTNFLTKMYSMDSRNIHKAQRFSRESVFDVEFKLQESKKVKSEIKKSKK